MLKMLTTWFLLCLGVWGASAGTHSFKAFYTATTGITNYPEFTAVGVVDGVLVTHYNSIIKQTVPRTEWMKNSEGPDYWKQQTDIIVGTEQAFQNNIKVAMGRFNQTGGVHTFMRTYGCEWDDETRAINGIYRDGYDGEDFITMDYKELRYIASVPQGVPSAQKWTNEKGNLEGWKNYLGTICVEWLQKYLQYGKGSLMKIVSPQVSLLQKSSSSPVSCHATGFYPSGVTISWMKNGRELHEDVDLGELLPNEDGTFQKTSSINVKPDEWKSNQFICVVEHQGKTKTVDEIRTNNGDSVPIGIIVGALAAVVLLILIGAAGFVVYKKKQGFKPVSGSDDGSNSSAQAVPRA